MGEHSVTAEHRVKELEAQLEEKDLGHHKAACEFSRMADKLMEERNAAISRAESAEARVRELERCLKLCRQCLHPLACYCCPVDAALRATEDK